MRRVLLVITHSLDPLNDVVTGVERTLPGMEVDVVDLTVEKPDYKGLLDSIFAADSVQVW